MHYIPFYVFMQCNNNMQLNCGYWKGEESEQLKFINLDYLAFARYSQFVTIVF